MLSRDELPSKMGKQITNLQAIDIISVR